MLFLTEFDYIVKYLYATSVYSLTITVVMPRSIAAKFYAFSFFDDFILIYPFYTLMFSDTGVSPGQIAFLLAAWSAVSFLLEVPSGAIADKFSRKNIMMIALALRLFGFGFWLFMPNFWGFLIGFLLWGINSAMTSGTQEALLYDELSRVKKTDLYAKIAGRVKAFSIAGAISSALVASLLAGFGYEFMLVCSLVASLTSIVAIGMLPRAKSVETTGEAAYWHYLKSGIIESFKVPTILLIVLFSGIVTGIAAIDEYYNLLFREKGFDNNTVAFWIAIVGVFEIAGALIAHRLEKRRFPLEIFMIIWAAALVGAALIGGIAAAVFVGIFAMMFSCIDVLFGARLQHSVSDDRRATVASVGGSLSELVALVLFAVIGLEADTSSYASAFLGIAVVIVFAAVFFWLFARFVSKKHGLKRLGL